MVGRNEPCPCGSGKKYKKCCDGKQQITAQAVYYDELERVLQSFYNEYPERKDIQGYIKQLEIWNPALEEKLQRELVEAIVLDDYFYHQKPDIWTGYLKKTIKKMVRPSTIKVLEDWTSPQMFVGKITSVATDYFCASHTLTGESVFIRRENDKHIPVGMEVFAFILSDGSNKEGHFLAVSTLIFFPVDHSKVFDKFAKQFKATDMTVEEYMKQEHLTLWKNLTENGYCGEELTSFESTVLTQAKDFLVSHERDAQKLMIVLEDYLIEEQPTARKEAAIAAGAIRFGQEKGLFESLAMTVKDIAESFGVSPSSLNKYYQELLNYYENK